MAPSPAERDELFKGFARALFKGDMDNVVRGRHAGFPLEFSRRCRADKIPHRPRRHPKTPRRAEALFLVQRFHDVAYHHSGDFSFMTFTVTETLRASGEQGEQRGIESYSFRDGKLATRTSIASPSQVDRYEVRG